MAEWIRVDDGRKPPLAQHEESISVSVLLYIPRWALGDDTGVRMGNYLHYSQKFRPEGSHHCEDYVTHWMALEPPAETK